MIGVAQQLRGQPRVQPLWISLSQISLQNFTCNQPPDNSRASNVVELGLCHQANVWISDSRPWAFWWVKCAESLSFWYLDADVDFPCSHFILFLVMSKLFMLKYYHQCQLDIWDLSLNILSFHLDNIYLSKLLYPFFHINAIRCIIGQFFKGCLPSYLLSYLSHLSFLI